MLRNRRTVVFAMLFPAAFFLLRIDLGLGRERRSRQRAGHVMVSMALYGAALTAASAGTQVALERAMGWSRQLRLTPLNPAVYIVVKAIIALVLGALAIAVVNLVGVLQGKPGDAGRRLGRVRCSTSPAPRCSPPSTVRRLPPAGRERHAGPRPRPGPCSLPRQRLHPDRRGRRWIRTIAQWTPMYGVAEICRYPLTGDLYVDRGGQRGPGLAVFVGGAAWAMARDTARV